MGFSGVLVFSGLIFFVFSIIFVLVLLIYTIFCIFVHVLYHVFLFSEALREFVENSRQQIQNVQTHAQNFAQNIQQNNQLYPMQPAQAFSVQNQPNYQERRQQNNLAIDALDKSDNVMWNVGRFGNNSGPANVDPDY
jgi:biopolymer transport protein ExbB/TolQ